MKCESCEATMINGRYCHEHGCPDAWKSAHPQCGECGADYKPRYKGQAYCESCENVESDLYDSGRDEGYGATEYQS